MRRPTVSPPTVSFVVAMSENRVIGRDNQLPWHLPADLAHFRRLTLGKPVVMGRKVFESVGRPLPERHNIVMTRNPDYRAPGCTVVHGPHEALEAAGDARETAIIGGEEIYRLFLARADVIHLTLVRARIEGDTFFPELNEAEWTEVERRDRPADERHAYDLTFLTLRRS